MTPVGRHDLPAGRSLLPIEAGRQNANLFEMREHNRHTSINMVPEYVRDQGWLREHAGDGFL
jgi:hypothetical protein